MQIVGSTLKFKCQRNRQTLEITVLEVIGTMQMLLNWWKKVNFTCLFRKGIIKILKRNYTACSTLNDLKFN